MCIINDDEKLVKQKSKAKQLVLWKVVKITNEVGLWRETDPTSQQLTSFHIGTLTAHDYISRHEVQIVPGAFHCFFTRKEARAYLKYYTTMSWNKPKIIKVYANSQDIVFVGTEKYSKLLAVSVSKMEIKSLERQR